MQEKCLTKGAPLNELSYYRTIVNQGHVDIQQQIYGHSKPHLICFYVLDCNIPIEIGLGLSML